MTEQFNQIYQPQFPGLKCTTLKNIQDPKKGGRVDNKGKGTKSAGKAMLGKLAIEIIEPFRSGKEMELGC